MGKAYQKQWDFLKGKFDAGKLGHAYILAGRDVGSVAQFTKEFVESIGGRFPDIMEIKPVEGTIAIKEIREVQNFLAYKSYNGGIKTVIIQGAEAMTVDAQDCFLKNLEEPKGQTLILFIVAKPDLLRQTILSRCQIIKFFGGTQPAVVSSELLKILQNDLAEKFKYAKNVNFKGDDFENIISALQNHFRNKDIAQHKDILKLLLDLEHQTQTTNINKKLALEIVLLNL